MSSNLARKLPYLPH